MRVLAPFSLGTFRATLALRSLKAYPRFRTVARDNSNPERKVFTMRFHIRWNGPRLPVSRARLQASLMALSVLVMAVAGSAGTKWHS